MARREGLAIVVLMTLAAGGPAGAQGMPVRRAGLWETKLIAGFPGAQSTVRSCIDPAADQQKMRDLQSRPAKDCSGIGPMTRTATGWSFHYVCKPKHGMTIDFTGAIKGDYNSHYTTTMVQRMTPPPVPEMAKITTVSEARWLGPCPAGMKVGTTSLNGQPAPNRY